MSNQSFGMGEVNEPGVLPQCFGADGGIFTLNAFDTVGEVALDQEIGCRFLSTLGLL